MLCIYYYSWQSHLFIILLYILYTYTESVYLTYIEAVVIYIDNILYTQIYVWDNNIYNNIKIIFINSITNVYK